MNDRQTKVTYHPMLDTGIGQEQGYASDEEFRAAMKSERDRMDLETRRLADEFEKEMARAFLFGRP
jgi:hypothetical protein